jgi:hypothetical protein
MDQADEGARFMAAFVELKSRFNDDPDRLVECWEQDERAQQLCDELHELAREFEVSEEWSALAFTPHVPAAAAMARRDYEERWARRVDFIESRWMHKLLARMIPGSTSPNFDRRPDELSIEIENWKYDARKERDLIEQSFEVLQAHQEIDEGGDLDWVIEAVWAWKRLTKVAGLDVEGALWRRRALPHILVPQHVANRYGQKRASLYRRLHEAGRAFVFGAPLAALALQRAALEELLREHWGAENGHVREAKLPHLRWDVGADRLKNLANDALHRDPEKLTREQLDRAIIENFIILRALIENAPMNAMEHQRRS